MRKYGRHMKSIATTIPGKVVSTVKIEVSKPTAIITMINEGKFKKHALPTL